MKSSQYRSLFNISLYSVRYVSPFQRVIGEFRKKHPFAINSQIISLITLQESVSLYYRRVKYMLSQSTRII